MKIHIYFYKNLEPYDYRNNSIQFFNISHTTFFFKQIISTTMRKRDNFFKLFKIHYLFIYLFIHKRHKTNVQLQMQTVKSKLH